MSRFLIEIPVTVYDVEAKQEHAATFGFDVEADSKEGALHQIERELLWPARHPRVAPLEWDEIPVDDKKGGESG